MNNPFERTLAVMSGALQPPHDVGPSTEFDPFDDDQMKYLFGDRMGEPIGGLLQLYRSAKLAQGCFGMDDKRFTEMVMPMLKQLAEGAIEVFKEKL